MASFALTYGLLLMAYSFYLWGRIGLSWIKFRLVCVSVWCSRLIAENLKEQLFSNPPVASSRRLAGNLYRLLEPRCGKWRARDDIISLRVVKCR